LSAFASRSTFRVTRAWLIAALGRPDAAGLGLSQAFAFARQSSGALAIDSTPGEGAEVSVTLPRAEQQDADASENTGQTDEPAPEIAS
jgi:signal transduction histidine kinase